MPTPRWTPRPQIAYGDGSVRSGPVTLARLAQALPSRGEPARAVGWGSDLAVLKALLDGLRRHGAAVGTTITAPAVRPSADPLPVLMVIADQRDFMRGSALLFLVADQGPRTPLLLPAVQAAREAARRATRGGEFELVLVQRPPAQGQHVPTESMSFNFTRI